MRTNASLVHRYKYFRGHAENKKTRWNEKTKGGNDKEVLKLLRKFCVHEEERVILSEAMLRYSGSKREIIWHHTRDC